MNRKEFFKQACKFGICSCAGFHALFSGEGMAAQSETQQEQKEDWRLGFIQRRFGKLLDLMEKSMAPETKDRLIEDLGRACAKESEEQFKNYKDNIPALLAAMKGQWIEDAEYDPEKNTVKLIGKPMDRCFCPFVDDAVTPKTFCNCSLGYQKQMYEMLFGRPVEASVLESVLRGGKRCSFFIRAV